MVNEKPKQTTGSLVFMIMAGIFITLAGLLGFVKSPEFMDIAMLISGLAMAGMGVYRILVPPTK